MARILVIDSYDSFVYNLVQYLGELGADPIVHRNDQLTVDEAVALAPDGVLLSPGPGRPETSGIICEAVTAFARARAPRCWASVSGIRRSVTCTGPPSCAHPS